VFVLSVLNLHWKIANRTITLRIIFGLILFTMTQTYGWACTTFQLKKMGSGKKWGQGLISDYMITSKALTP
jgi:hypothetical protein